MGVSAWLALAKKEYFPDVALSVLPVQPHQRWDTWLKLMCALTSVMINFMSTSLAMGCPDIWLKIILGMSVKVFLDGIDIWISRLS